MGEVLQELCPRRPYVHVLARVPLDPVQLKHPLRCIHADDRWANLHPVPSRLPEKSTRFPLGTFMLSARPVHSTIYPPT